MGMLPRISEAQNAQRKHWETLGQLVRIQKLLAYMSFNNEHDYGMIEHIEKVRSQVDRAVAYRTSNNEFINPSSKKIRKGR